MWIRQKETKNNLDIDENSQKEYNWNIKIRNDGSLKTKILEKH